MAAKAPALAAYREVLRAVHKTFRGDAFALKTVYKEVRGVFDANRQLTDPAEIQSALGDAREGSLFILQNVVQATKSSCGTLEVTPDHVPRLKNQGAQGPEDTNPELSARVAREIEEAAKNIKR